MRLREAVREEWSVTVPLVGLVDPFQVSNAYQALESIHNQVVRPATKDSVSPWVSIEIHWAALNAYDQVVVVAPTVVSSATRNTVYCKFGYGTAADVHSRFRDIERFPFRESMRGGYSRQRNIHEAWLLGSRRADWVDAKGRLCRRIQLVVVHPPANLHPARKFSGSALKEILDHVSLNTYARPLWCVTNTHRLQTRDPLLRTS